MAKENGFKGGYDVELLDGLDDKHRCPYCKLLLRDPVQTSCGHRLCSPCQKDLLIKSGNGPTFMCPACQEMNSVREVYPDKFATREIASFKTACRFKNCPWKGEVRHFEAHVETCKYARVPCPNDGCMELVMKDSLNRHKTSECSFRPVECPNCHESVPFKKKEWHRDECPKEPITCPNGCSKSTFLREQLEAHLKECPNEPMECPYNFAGCKFKGRRSSLNKHLKDEALSHMEMASKQFVTLKSELHVMTEKYKDARKKTEELVEIAKNADRTMKENRVQIDSLSVAQSSLKLQLEEMENSVKRVHDQPLYMRSDNAMSLNLQLSQLQERADMAERQIKELELSSVEGASADSTGFDSLGLFSLPSLEHTEVPVERRLDNVDKQLAMQDVQVAELNLKLQLLEVTSYNGTMIWKIDSMERRRNDALRGKMPSLYSPPFYIGRFGYKACARIYLNGDGMGKGKHVSLFFTIMRGEYDALLPWPFQQKVTFKILDLEKTNHIVETFRPDPYSSSFRRPAGDMNLASGCPQFVEQTKVFRENLSNTPYVKNNTMFVEISVDTTGLRLEV